KVQSTSHSTVFSPPSSHSSESSGSSVAVFLASKFGIPSPQIGTVQLKLQPGVLLPPSSHTSWSSRLFGAPVLSAFALIWPSPQKGIVQSLSHVAASTPPLSQTSPPSSSASPLGASGLTKPSPHAAILQLML